MATPAPSGVAFFGKGRKCELVVHGPAPLTALTCAKARFKAQDVAFE